MTDAIIEIFMKFIVIYCIGCFGGSLLWKTKIDWKIRRFTMSLPTPKKMLQRVKKEATSYCNVDPLAFAIGIRNGFLMVMPFWLVVLYLVIWKRHNYERVKNDCFEWNCRYPFEKAGPRIHNGNDKTKASWNRWIRMGENYIIIFNWNYPLYLS